MFTCMLRPLIEPMVEESVPSFMAIEECDSKFAPPLL